MLNNQLKKKCIAYGHQLHPIVIIGSNGLTTAVSNEFNRALDDHELIKIKLHSTDKVFRQKLLNKLSATHACEVINVIGKVALILRLAPLTKPAKHSNLKKIKFGS